MKTAMKGERLRARLRLTAKRGSEPGPGRKPGPRPATTTRLGGTIRRVALNISLILLTGGTLLACEDAIEGRVSMVGSEPFTYLAITTGEGRQVELTGEKAEELQREYQGRQVRVHGEIVREEQGPGRPARLEVLRFEVLEE